MFNPYLSPPEAALKNPPAKKQEPPGTQGLLQGIQDRLRQLDSDDILILLLILLLVGRSENRRWALLAAAAYCIL